MLDFAMNNNLTSRRLALGLTQAETAARARISQSAVNKAEAGVVPVQVAGAIRLARALGISVEDLYAHDIDKKCSTRGRTLGPRRPRGSSPGDPSSAPAAPSAPVAPSFAEAVK